MEALKKRLAEIWDEVVFQYHRAKECLFEHRFCLVAVVIAAALTFIATKAKADDVLVFTDKQGTSVFLTNEPCAMKDTVVNLPYRVRWVEADGKVVEGCGGQHQSGLIIFYFADKTVGLDHPANYKPVKQI